MVLGTFMFCRKSVAHNVVCCHPHRGEGGVHLSLCHRESSVPSHLMWHKPMPQRQDPAIFSPIEYVPTPAAKNTVAAFLRHTCADSSAQIPCTITERKALTAVAKSCDCERSYLLWLPVHSSCQIKHVPQSGLVNLC